MDKISVLGLVIGLVAIIGGQVLEGGHLGSLSQPTALLIVLGGTMGAVMLQSPYATFVRGMRMAIDHPVEGTAPSIGFAVKLSGTPQQVRRHPPLLGEHTEEVLAELGLDAAARERLRAGGAFGS